MSMEKRENEAHRKKRNALINTNFYWLARVIPYRIDPKFTDEEKNSINVAIKEWTTYTCVKIMRASKTNSDFLYFQKSAYYFLL